MKDRAESGCPVGMCFCSVMSNSLVQGQAHGHWTTASGIAFSIVNSMLLFANCALLTLAVAAHSAPRRLFDSTDQKGLQSVQVTLLRLPRRLVLFRLASVAHVSSGSARQTACLPRRALICRPRLKDNLGGQVCPARVALGAHARAPIRWRGRVVEAFEPGRSGSCAGGFCAEMVGNPFHC